jgi:hypothetical protein
MFLQHVREWLPVFAEWEWDSFAKMLPLCPNPVLPLGLITNT